MKNTEKALALIGTFATGDVEKARELLADGYIQHNLAFGTGAAAFIGAVVGLRDIMETLADKETWQNENGKF